MKKTQIITTIKNPQDGSDISLIRVADPMQRRNFQIAYSLQVGSQSMVVCLSDIQSGNLKIDSLIKDQIIADHEALLDELDAKFNCGTALNKW